MPRYRRDRASAIELGTEPPLRVDGDDSAPLDRRALSVRWFAGTILTAVAGSTLMGGAIYSALDGETRFADLPRFAAIARNAVDFASNLARKGDRISVVVGPESVGARSTLRVSTTTKVGDREIVKVRPFTRVAATLTMAPTEFAKSVPEFNPVKLMADSDVDRIGAEPDTDGDLSFTIRDLADIPLAVDEGPVVPTSDVLAQVREIAAFEVASRFQAMRGGVTPVATGAGTVTAYAPTGDIGSDFMPNNMTLLAKSTAVGEVKSESGETTVTVKADTSMESLLRDQGASPAEARAITAAFGSQNGYGLAQVRAGYRVKILNGAASPLSARPQPVRVSIFSDAGHVGSVALSDTGGYVAVADLGDDPDDAEEEEQAPGKPGRMRIYNSIYETALRQAVPQPIIDELVRTVSFDIDFNRRVVQGDALEIFFSDDEDDRPELLYATLTLGGEQRRFYRYQSPDDSVIDYYDESGRSARKFLMRKPMNGGIMRSGYGARRHPILGYTKMHTGVDWANPTGSPIVSSGNGVIESAEWQGGYGKQVKIRHTNGYETAYGHMSAFARGIKPGVRVRQGQIIGYVGSTGLSTGPHLHYEVLVNGRFVNPMRVKLPRGRELEGNELVAFQKERQRVEELLARAAAGSTAALNRPQGG
jgi:murein DD-endopeptidase MepM/ murein hydrolase activator NlpD